MYPSRQPKSEGKTAPARRLRGTGPGWLYVLSNPSMPGVLKAGMTRATPSARARQLAAVTGVPAQFRVVASIRVDHPEAAEREMHLRLARWRVNRRREFFRVGRRRAVRAMNAAAGQVSPVPGLLAACMAAAAALAWQPAW